MKQFEALQAFSIAHHISFIFLESLLNRHISNWLLLPEAFCPFKQKETFFKISSI